jgi:hypothetical protein
LATFWQSTPYYKTNSSHAVNDKNAENFICLIKSDIYHPNASFLDLSVTIDSKELGLDGPIVYDLAVTYVGY